MRIYENGEWRTRPPAEGEIFVCPDEHRRCFPESWIVCKSTTCPCSNIITKGIFWNIEDAILFANALQAKNEINEMAKLYTELDRTADPVERARIIAEIGILKCGD
jgi:hypothetical protein